MYCMHAAYIFSVQTHRERGTHRYKHINHAYTKENRANTLTHTLTHTHAHTNTSHLTGM